MGMFNYGGRLVSSNPAIDFMYVREGRNLSVSAFKAFDLYDVHTDNNFTAVFLYRNFNVAKRFVVTPSLGFVAPQLHSIADKGSDFAARLAFSYKLLPHLTLEHTSIITNIALDTEYRDWVNRLRLTYSKKSIDASLTVWHNNNALDNSSYFTTAVNLAYARIRVSNHLLMSTGITSVIMPYSDDRELNPKKNGLLMTVAAVIH